MNTVMIGVVIYLLAGAFLAAWLAHTSDWFSDSPLPRWHLVLACLLLWPAIIVMGIRQVWQTLGPE